MAARPKLKLKRWLYFPIVLVVILIATILFRINALNKIPKVSMKTAESVIATEEGNVEPTMPIAARLFAYANDGKWGYKDELGNIVSGLEAQFDSADEFSEGFAFATRGTAENKIYALIDSRGQIVADNLNIQEVKAFSGGYAAYKKDGKWGYMNASGLSVVQPQYDFAGDVSKNTFSRGMSVPGMMINTTSTTTSTTTEPLIGEENQDANQGLEPASGGGDQMVARMASANSQDNQGAVYGNVDSNAASPGPEPANSLAPAATAPDTTAPDTTAPAATAPDNANTGGIVYGEENQQQADTAIEPQVDNNMIDIEAGIAAVGINGKYGYIAPGLGNSEMFIKLKYDFAGDFSENFAFVGALNADGSLNYSIIDIGDVSIKNISSTEGTYFSHSMAVVKVAPDVYKFYEYSGTIVDAFVNPQTGESARFENAKNFKEDLAAVKIDGSWGFISASNVLPVIAPIYTEVRSFNEGYAAVKDSSGKWGVIDKSGVVTVPMEYDEISDFQNGYALAKKSAGDQNSMMAYSLSLNQQAVQLYTINSSEFSSETATKLVIKTEQSTMNIRSRPSTESDSDKIAIVEKGTKVELIEVVGEWSKIRLPSGVEGYAMNRYLAAEGSE